MIEAKIKKTLTIIAVIITIIVLLLYAQFVFGESLVVKDTSGIYQAANGEVEMESHRTRSFKKFRKGRQRRIAGQIGPIHYRQNPFSDVEQWKDIDLTINLTPGESWDAAMETNGYQVRFWNSRQIVGKTVRYIAQFRRAGKWLAMVPLGLRWENDAGQRELISKPVGGITPAIDNDAYRITWADCFGPGIDYRYNIRPDEFFKTVIVNAKSDLPAPTIGLSGLKLTVVLGISWHSQSKVANGFAGSVTPDEVPNDTDDSVVDEELVNSDKFAYKDELLRETFWMQKPKAWDSDDHDISIDWRLLRRGNKIFAIFSVDAALLNSPQVVYPVYIDVPIAEVEVVAANDDCHRWYPSTFRISSWYTGAGRISAGLTRMTGGHRFQSVPLPNGSTIDTATLTFTSATTRTAGHVHTYIRAEAADDPGDFLITIGEFDARFGVLTTAKTDWSHDNSTIGNQWNIGDVFVSNDISVVIKELVDRPGWASGQAMVIFWDDDDNRSVVNDPGDSYRQAAGFDNATYDPAKLNVNYTEASSGQVIMIQGN